MFLSLKTWVKVVLAGALLAVFGFFAASKSSAVPLVPIQEEDFFAPLNHLFLDVRDVRIHRRVQRGSPPDFPTADPVSEGIDPAALQRLLDRADAEHSDAVLILRHGKLLVTRGAWDKKIMAMSATKSITSLAVGALIEDGRISSLDQLVSDFIPEWSQGEKNKVTLRMLLNHTSGLDTGGRGVAYALKAPLVFAPGTEFAYNNPAVDLLALLIERASGVRADLYIAKRLFEPLGITDWAWMLKGGYPLTAGELEIRPIDLAKIGQMMLDGGVWKGRQVIHKSWVEWSAEVSQPFDPTYGGLWWRDAEVRSLVLTSRIFAVWSRAGMRPEIVEPLRPLVGRPMKNDNELRAAIEAAYAGNPEFLKEFDAAVKRGRLQRYEVIELGPVEGFSARGWLGQFLVVDPKRRLIGIRMRDSRDSDYPTPENPNPVIVDKFSDFPRFVHDLAPGS